MSIGVLSRGNLWMKRKKTNVHVKHCANNARMRDGLKRKYDEQVLCAKVTTKCIRSTLRLSIDVVRMIQTQKSELKHRKWKKEKWNTHNNCGRLCVLFFITVRRIRTNVPFKFKRITCTLIIKCANYGALDWATMNHFSFSAWILKPRFFLYSENVRRHHSMDSMYWTVGGLVLTLLSYQIFGDCFFPFCYLIHLCTGSVTMHLLAVRIIKCAEI